MENNTPPLNRAKFLSHFEGMNDLAQFAITSFLSSLPKFIKTIETAIQCKNSLDLQIAAHTLKGSVSNFFAETCVVLAEMLEQLGKSKALEKANEIFDKLRIELERLAKTLAEILSGELAA